MSELEKALAEQLEAEVPYRTCSSLMTHEGWLDVVVTIKTVWPEAYAAMIGDMKLREQRAQKKKFDALWG